MLNVNKVIVSNSFGMEKLIVSFYIDDTDENLDDYTFNVYRSETGTDDYQCIAQNVGYYYFEDYSVNLYNNNIKYFYKIEIVNQITGQRELSESFGFLEVNEPDMWGSAIEEIERAYLHYVIKNDTMLLLKKKRFGQVCRCYDDIRYQTDPKCLSCYGTKYVGGYENAVPIEVNYQNPSQRTQIFEVFDMDGEERSPIQLWTFNFPIVQPEDVLIDSKNNRYRVVSVTPTTKNNFILRQIISIQRIQTSDIVYKIPLIRIRKSHYEEDIAKALYIKDNGVEKFLMAIKDNKNFVLIAKNAYGDNLEEALFSKENKANIG